MKVSIDEVRGCMQVDCNTATRIRERKRSLGYAPSPERIYQLWDEAGRKAHP